MANSRDESKPEMSSIAMRHLTRSLKTFGFQRLHRYYLPPSTSVNVARCPKVDNEVT